MFIKSVSLLRIILFVLQLLHLVLSLNDNEKSLSTSISGMVNLLEIEMQLIDSLENYKNELQKKLDVLKNLVNQLKDENHKSLNEREEYLFNPLNGFSLIRRFYNDWPRIELFISKTVGQEYLASIQKCRTSMPTTSDLMEASASIYRLQTVYDLHVDDLGRGKINGKQYDAKLKSIDSYFMGYYLFTKKLYYPAAVWLNYSIIHFEKDFNPIVDFGKEQPLELYAEALLMQNRPQEALTFINQASDLNAIDAYLLNRKSEIKNLYISKNESPSLFPQKVLSNYELGCRRSFANQTSKMFCIYNTTTSPFLRLAPLKMEILSWDPYVVIFHEVISDSEIEHLKYLARPNLVRAEIYEHKVRGPIIDEARTSQLSWFYDHTDEIFVRVNKRIIDMTGLNLLDSEVMQVGNYIMGGHYDAHYDFFNVSDDSEIVATRGDRISTILFYLSDVEQGGATIFPEIKISVLPRKGSALMWYNLNNKLEVDDRTLHAACPVLVGSKWVCTKWIRANAQVFKKPCYT